MVEQISNFRGDSLELVAEKGTALFEALKNRSCGIKLFIF